MKISNLWALKLGWMSIALLSITPGAWALSGTLRDREVSNGGDLTSIDFVTLAHDSVNRLVKMPATLLPAGLDVAAISTAVDHALVESTDDALSLDGVPKDALNTPATQHIVVNRTAWGNAAPLAKRVLVVHELLGLSSIEDLKYQISTPTAEMLEATTSAGETPSATTGVGSASTAGTNSGATSGTDAGPTTGVGEVLLYELNTTADGSGLAFDAAAELCQSYTNLYSNTWFLVNCRFIQSATTSQYGLQIWGRGRFSPESPWFTLMTSRNLAEFGLVKYTNVLDATLACRLLVLDVQADDASYYHSHCFVVPGADAGTFDYQIRTQNPLLY